MSKKFYRLTCQIAIWGILLLLVCGCGTDGGVIPLQPGDMLSDNPTPVNQNPGIVRVGLGLPFNITDEKVEIYAGLSPVVPDGDDYLIELTPGFSQLVWAMQGETLIGMAIIIDSALVPEVTIDARSTIAATLFLTPFVAKADLAYDLPTWQFINSLPNLDELAAELTSIMKKVGPGYLYNLPDEDAFMADLAEALEAVLTSEPVRMANGNIVDPEGKIKGLELVDNFETYNEPDDFIVRNYWHRWAKVVYPNPVGIESFKYLEPGTLDNPNEETIIVDYGDDDKKTVKAYTVAPEGLLDANSKDIPHLIDIWIKNITCGVGMPMLKIVIGPPAVLLESAFCECGTDLLATYLEQHPDELESFIDLILNKKVLKVGVLGVCMLGQAAIDDWDQKGWDSCLGTTIENIGVEGIKALLDAIGSFIGLPIGKIISGLQGNIDIVKLGIACFKGQSITKWTVEPQEAPPAMPILVKIPPPGGPYSTHRYCDVFLLGDYAILADYWLASGYNPASILKILAINPPENTHVVGSIKSSKDHTTGFLLTDFDNYLVGYGYVGGGGAGYTHKGIYLYDLTKDLFDEPFVCYFPDCLHVLTFGNTYAYSVNKASRLEIFQHNLPNMFASVYESNYTISKCLARDNNVLYISRGACIVSLNIEDPYNIQELDSYALPEGVSAEGMKLASDILLVTCRSFNDWKIKLMLFNCFNPNDIKKIDSVTLWGSPAYSINGRIEIIGNHIFLALGGNGFQRIRIDNDYKLTLDGLAGLEQDEDLYPRYFQVDNNLKVAYVSGKAFFVIDVS